MPLEGARLVWVTPEQDAELGEMIDGSEIPNELIPLTEIRCAFGAAPEPVARRRCTMHDAERAAYDEEYGDYCYEIALNVARGWPEEPEPCRFVTEWTTTTAPPEEPA
jgi:hypothetical protein